VFSSQLLSPTTDIMNSRGLTSTLPANAGCYQNGLISLVGTSFNGDKTYLVKNTYYGVPGDTWAYRNTTNLGYHSGLCAAFPIWNIMELVPAGGTFVAEDFTNPPKLVTTRNIIAPFIYIKYT